MKEYYTLGDVSLSVFKRMISWTAIKLPCKETLIKCPNNVVVPPIGEEDKDHVTLFIFHKFIVVKL